MRRPSAGWGAARSGVRPRITWSGIRRAAGPSTTPARTSITPAASCSGTIPRCPNWPGWSGTCRPRLPPGMPRRWMRPASPARPPVTMRLPGMICGWTSYRESTRAPSSMTCRQSGARPSATVTRARPSTCPPRRRSSCGVRASGPRSSRRPPRKRRRSQRSRPVRRTGRCACCWPVTGRRRRTRARPRSAPARCLASGCRRA